MFTLVNPSGNAERAVRSEVKKEALLKEGWKPVEETPSVTAGAVPPPSGREAAEPDAGAAPDATEGVSEPELPKAPKNKRKGASAGVPAEEE